MNPQTKIDALAVCKTGWDGKNPPACIWRPDLRQLDAVIRVRPGVWCNAIGKQVHTPTAAGQPLIVQDFDLDGARTPNMKGIHLSVSSDGRTAFSAVRVVNATLRNFARNAQGDAAGTHLDCILLDGGAMPVPLTFEGLALLPAPTCKAMLIKDGNWPQIIFSRCSSASAIQIEVSNAAEHCDKILVTDSPGLNICVSGWNGAKIDATIIRSPGAKVQALRSAYGLPQLTVHVTPTTQP